MKINEDSLIEIRHPFFGRFTGIVLREYTDKRGEQLSVQITCNIYDDDGSVLVRRGSVLYGSLFEVNIIIIRDGGMRLPEKSQMTVTQKNGIPNGISLDKKGLDDD